MEEVYLQAILLGIVQGICEFLPISSSAHLLLLPQLADLPYWGKSFDVALHGGSLVALLLYKRKLWLQILNSWRSYLSDMWHNPAAREWPSYRDPFLSLGFIALVGAIPVALLGFLLEDYVEVYAHNPYLIATTLALWGVAMVWSDRQSPNDRELESVGWGEAWRLGIVQSLALFPGVSRSGAVLTISRLLGFARPQAGLVALVTALPVVGGAFLVKMARGFVLDPALGLGPLVAGVAASFLAGLASIRLLEGILERANLIYFAGYRLALSLLIFLRLI